MMMTHLKADLFICDDCGLVSSDILPDPSIYDKSYDIKYQRYARTAAGELLQNIRLATVLDGISEKGINCKILDFGCGSGSFVRCHEDIKGFDINPYGSYCDVTSLLNGFEVVTFWDSLEHIQDPKKLIKGLKAEYVFISTPSIDDFIGELTEFHHYYPGEHVHYFSAESLNKLMESCGYEKVSLHYRESTIRTSGGDKNILTMGFKRGSN